MIDVPNVSPYLQLTLRGIEDAAHDDGRRDRRRRKPRHPCPYRTPRISKAWAEGWDAENADLKIKEMTDG